jgi:hypothetical protein
MKSAIQVVALLVVLVGGVFGVTFLTQFVRKPAGEPTDGRPVQYVVKQLLVSPESRERQGSKAIYPDWAAITGIPGYQSLEMEKGTKHHYDFLLTNVTDKLVSVFLNSQFSCTCARLKVSVGVVPDEQGAKLAALKTLPVGPAVEPYVGGVQWKVLEYDATRGPSVTVEIPAPDSTTRYAVVRMAWETTEIKQTTLKAEIIARQGSTADRLNFEVPISVTAAVLSSTSPSDVVYVGDLNPGDRREESFFVWSATRADFPCKAELSVPDPCIEVVPPRRLTAEELKALPAQLAAKAETKTLTNARCAYEIKVAASEHVGDNQLELGPFARRLFVNRGTDTEVVVVLAGTVRGPIQVGDVNDREKVDLRIFRADHGAQRVLTITCPTPGQTLAIDKIVPADVIQAELTPVKTAAGASPSWKLTVFVPPNVTAGQLPFDSAIYLKMGTNPPRRVRIPVAGNASG